MDLLEKSDDFFQFPDIQIGMLFKPMPLKIVFEDLREGMYPFAADYGPIQLQEATVGVLGKSWVGGQLRQSFDDFIVDAEVEQGIHHPGHGLAGTGTHREKKRIVEISELLSHDLFDFGDIRADFRLKGLGVVLLIGVIIGADLGRDAETSRDRDADTAHLSEVGSLTTEKRLLGSVSICLAVSKKVDVLRGLAGGRFANGLACCLAFGCHREGRVNLVEKTSHRKGIKTRPGATGRAL